MTSRPRCHLVVRLVIPGCPSRRKGSAQVPCPSVLLWGVRGGRSPPLSSLTLRRLLQILNSGRSGEGGLTSPQKEEDLCGAGASGEPGCTGRRGDPQGLPQPAAFVLCRSLTGNTFPTSHPTAISLSCSCHDNQSSPSVPKMPQKQQRNLHPRLGGKRAMEGPWFKACSPAPQRSPQLGTREPATGQRQRRVWGVEV